MARGRPPKRTTKDATRKQIRDKLHYMSETAELPFDASSLSFEERRLLVVMADPRRHVEKTTISQLCEDAGISYSAYRRAVSNPEFNTALNGIVTSTIKQAILPMVRAGVQFAMDGSFKHWEALMKLGGQLDTADDKEIVIRFASSHAAAAPIEAEYTIDDDSPPIEAAPPLNAAHDAASAHTHATDARPPRVCVPDAPPAPSYTPITIFSPNVDEQVCGDPREISRSENFFHEYSDKQVCGDSTANGDDGIPQSTANDFDGISTADVTTADDNDTG